MRLSEQHSERCIVKIPTSPRRVGDTMLGRRVALGNLISVFFNEIFCKWA